MKPFLLLVFVAGTALLCGCQHQNLDKPGAPAARPTPVAWQYDSFSLASSHLAFEGSAPKNYVIVLISRPGGSPYWGPTNWVSNAADVMQTLGGYGWDLVCYDVPSKSYIVKRPAGVWTDGSFMVSYILAPVRK